MHRHNSKQRRNKLKTLLRISSNCWLCGLPTQYRHPVEALKATVDHVVPKSHGGINFLDNLMPAHQLCNHYRGNSTPPPEQDTFREYLEKRGYLKFLLEPETVCE